MASTFKSFDSLSSTDENIMKQKLQGRKSESDKTGHNFLEHFQLLLSCLILPPGNIRGILSHWTKSPPKNRLLLPSSNFLVKIETPLTTTPPTPRAPPAGLFASSPAPWSRSLSSGVPLSWSETNMSANGHTKCPILVVK